MTHSPLLWWCVDLFSFIFKGFPEHETAFMSAKNIHGRRIGALTPDQFDGNMELVYGDEDIRA